MKSSDPRRPAPWWAPWAIIGLVLFTWISTTAYFAWLDQRDTSGRQIIRLTQIESCERVNVLREEVNVHVAILEEFLETAAEVRADEDAEISDRYRDLLEELQPIPLTDCENAFPPQASIGAP